MDEAMRRPCSLVSERASTQKVIAPGESNCTPSWRLTTLQRGGRIDDTVTRFCWATPAWRSASSNDLSLYLLRPTPRVRNIFVGTRSSIFSPNRFISQVPFIVIRFVRTHYHYGN